MRVDGRNVRAHRIALIRDGADPGPAVKVLHSCDNPPCCNPRHLSFGTQADNITDMHSKGRRSYERKPKPPRKPRAGRYTHVTHCTNGHEFSDDNTRLKPNPKVPSGFERVCITCNKARNKQQAARRKAERHKLKQGDN